MTDATRRALAVTGAVLTVLLTVHAYLLAPGINGNPGLPHAYVIEDGLTADSIVLAVMGALLCWARPRNPVGALLLTSGLLETLCVWGSTYGTRALVVPDSRLPGGALVLSLTGPLWLLGLVLPATVLLARYPTGRVTGRWSRRLDRVVQVALVTAWAGYAVSPESVTDAVTTARAPLELAIGMPVLVVSSLVLLAGLVLTAAIAARRLLTASWPERPQLALLLSFAPLSVVAVMFSPYEWIGSVFFNLMPLAVVVGVLRYRLLGIEVVVRRTLLYASLTAVVLLVFVLVTSTLTAVLPDGGAPQLLAAVVVAVVVAPAKDRLQRVVDRLVYGDRSDPWAAFDRLGREALDASDLQDVVAALARTLRVPGVQLWGVDGPVASWGDPVQTTTTMTLSVGSDVVGELRVAPRRGEKALGTADERLLSALAPLVAVVLRSTQLAEALRVEQERVVQATTSERARLRRDLHDGLGPSLTGIGLGLEAVDSDAVPERQRTVVRRLRAEVSASLEEVRRIIDDLRPGALETADLLTLVRARAEHLSATTPVRVLVEAPASVDVTPEVEAAALRIVEEALTNVVRHAQATSCTVRIDDEHGLRVEVTDDGIGFAGPRQGGVGLTSMRTRAAALGGSLELAAAERGTVLVALLPA